MSAELCTNQGDRIRTAVESLKDFGQEGVIFFRRDGVELVGRDNAGVVDVRLLLEASKIRETGGHYEYNCADDCIELGIRTKVVAMALKRFSPGDRVAIGARRGQQREFYISCKSKGKTFTSDIVAPASEDIGRRTPPSMSGSFSYSGSVVMSSAMFHGIIGDILTADPPVITLVCNGKTLNMSGEGMFSRGCVEIGDEEDEEDEEEEDEEDGAAKPKAVFQKTALGTWDVRDSYATIHLQRIAKAKNMAPRIILTMGQNAPASFEYDTPIGKLTYLVCARTADDIDDPRQRGPAQPPSVKKRKFEVSDPVPEFDYEGECDDV